MKNFVVDVDITMSRSFEVEAENEQLAKNKVYSMIKANPYDFTHGFTHCVDYEIVDSYEVVDYM